MRGRIAADGSMAFGTKACSSANVSIYCSKDGQVGCVTTDSFTAADMQNAATKILAGATLGGVSGNVTLPAVNRVLTGTNFGVSGMGSSGSLTLPSAGNVLSSSGIFGDASALTTPTLTLPAAGKVLSATSYGVAGTGSTGIASRW